MTRQVTRSWALPAAALGVVGVLVGFVFAIWLGPRLIAREVLADSGSSTADREKAVHDSRVMIISLGGGLVIVTGLLYTARNYRLNHRGQITDRFANALERLGSNELYIRIGGIHALEHVMHESSDFETDVVQVLGNFIRARSPRRGNTKKSNTNWMHPPGWPEEPDLPDEPRSDVQAALSALGRRPVRKNYSGAIVNLRGLHLRGADLTRVNFSEVDLEGTDLSGSRLDFADFTSASLIQADLTEARLSHAKLISATLDNAQLTYTRLSSVDLTDASLDEVNLTGANLRNANLTNAYLDRARMVNANFHNVIFVKAHLGEADLTGANLSHADLTEAFLAEANLTDANLRNAKLDRADFEEAEMTRATIMGYIHNTNISPRQLSQAMSENS